MAFGNILLAALGIGMLIFVHELGHFLAARLAGVRVEVFSLGFGSRLCGFVWRDTDFRLSLVPFGGYVMVAGQDPSDDRYPRRESLHGKSLGQRALFWSGGVLMNALFALLVFPLVFRAGVDFPAPVIGRIGLGSPAWEAAVAPGDRVLEVAGKAIHSFDQLRMQVALAGNRPVPLRLRAADGTERTVTLQPRWNSAAGLWEIGVEAAADPSKPPTILVPAKSQLLAAGVQTGDALLAIDGATVVDTSAALARLQQPTGDSLELRLRRHEAELTIQLTPQPTNKLRIGVAPAATVVAGIRQGSAVAERLGLRRDDIVLAVDGKAFGGDRLPILAGPAVTVHVARTGQELVLRTDLTTDEGRALGEAVVLRPGRRLLLSPVADSPAQLAGLQPGDLLVAVDGKPVSDFEQLRDQVESAGSRTLQFSVRRAVAAGASFLDPEEADLARPTSVELRIAPRLDAVPDLDVGLLFTEQSEVVRGESFAEALQLGTACSLDLVKQLYVTLKRMVTGDVGAKNLGGIIRISQVSYQAAQRGWTWFLYLLAVLSVNLAFVNLLPVPVLDGGHLLFLLIEKVKGSPVSARVFGYSQVVGLVFVLMLVLFVTYNDILQLL